MEMQAKDYADKNGKNIKSSKSDKFIDSFANFIYSNDPRKWLILITVFGFFLRLINVGNRLVYGDPPHFTINAINFLGSGFLSLWDQSAFLWYASTDIFYKLFGITQFASRFASLLFGTATIIAIYLFVKEFSGNKNLALVSSLIYALAPAFLFHAADEHDIAVLFFIVMIFYFLIKGLKQNSKKYLLLSGAAFGVASMWKFYVPIFAVPCLGMIWYFSSKKSFAENPENCFRIKDHYKTLLYIVLIILLFMSPTLVYNYSNYKHNGIPTFFFVKFLGGENNPVIQNVYGWVSAGELYKDSVSLEIIVDAAVIGLKNSLFSNGKVLWAIALLGMILMFIKRNKDSFAKDYLVFFLFYFIIPFIFMINANTLFKHYVNFLAMATPIIAYFFIYLSKSFNISGWIKKHLGLFIILLILFEIFAVMSLPFHGGSLFFTQNPEGKLMEYKSENIPEQSLIIYDERIYNSLAGWLFNDRYFISTINYGKFNEFNQQSKNLQNMPVYFIECGVGSCGWASNPQLDNFSNALFSSIRQSGAPEVFSAKRQLAGRKYFAPFFSKNTETDKYFKVYKTQMPVDLNIAKAFKEQYNYFMYPLEYKNMNQPTVQNFIYTPDSFIEIILNKIAWLIFYLEIVLSFGAILFVFYELQS